MREHGLSPKQRRRYVTTTDSDHDEPIIPNLAADMAPDGPNQLWVADITYVAIATGFVYLAAILDAWSRRVVGYAISRSIDARLTIAALDAAVRSRGLPRAACITATAVPTIIGLIAGCLSSWSLVPQLLKCWREGLAEAVSKKMFATRAIGLVLWCIYGYFAGSVPVVIFSSLNLVLSITILVLTIRNSSVEEGA